MKYLRITAACLVFVLSTSWFAAPLAAADKSPAQKPAWKSLFDGKTLSGWHPVGDGEWVVEDGAIVGKTDRAAKLYGLLVSDQVYKDLEVRLKFKSIKGNSGFYVRGYIVPPDRAHGLQVEVDPRGSTGGIYESYGRAWISKPSPELVEQYFKLDQWNEMTITAKGGDVVVKVNGVQAAELKNDPVQSAGHLILQMHAGNEMLVMFKDIEVLDLSDRNRSKPIRPASDGSLTLHAADAKAVGPKIKYMPEWKAFGWWTDQDHCQWTVEVPKAVGYDVWLEWSVGDKHAGKEFVFQVGDRTLKGTIGKTGSWETYRKAKIGRMQLEAGSQTATFRPAGKLKTALLDLREVRLVPVKPEK